MEGKIIFIDGFCVLCNGLAQYVLINDRSNAIKIASLQGETAKKMLSIPESVSLDTVVYLRNGIPHIQSTAVLYLISDMGGWRKVVKLLLIIPKGIRDWIYKGVAKRRYKWFGKNESCRLPGKEGFGRVLD